MRRPLLAALSVTLALGACGAIRDSRVNPFNWFGGSKAEAPSPLAAPVDQRLLVASVTDLTLERMPNGVIIRATGLPPTQGYWEAELVARPIEDGKAVYDFRVFPPTEKSAVSTVQSREVIVATFLSNIKLEGITQITVQAQTNARSSRR